jgi:hypothetical protein
MMAGVGMDGLGAIVKRIGYTKYRSLSEAASPKA